MPNPTSPSPNPTEPLPLEPRDGKCAEGEGQVWEQEQQEQSDPFEALPTETEIYILPSGEIVVADLPQELAARLFPTAPMLGPSSNCAKPD